MVVFLVCVVGAVPGVRGGSVVLVVPVVVI
jgi:hypothetical protein